MTRDDWDNKIPVVLWAYGMRCNKLTGQTPFRLVYEKEVVMPMEYIVPSLRIVAITEMIDVGAIEGILSQLLQLEEVHFVLGYHQRVEKE